MSIKSFLSCKKYFIRSNGCILLMEVIPLKIERNVNKSFHLTRRQPLKCMDLFNVFFIMPSEGSGRLGSHFTHEVAPLGKWHNVSTKVVTHLEKDKEITGLRSEMI